MAPIPVSFKNSLRFIRATFLFLFQLIEHVVNTGEPFLRLMQGSQKLASMTLEKADARSIIWQRRKLASAGIGLIDSLLISAFH